MQMGQMNADVNWRAGCYNKSPDCLSNSRGFVICTWVGAIGR